MSTDMGQAEPPASGGYYRTGEFLRAKHRRVRYDSGRDFPRWAFDLVRPGPEWRVLDAGCGWGRFLWPLLEIYGVRAAGVVGLDRSPGMLRTAREEADRRGAAICFCQGSIEALPFADGTFDLAIAAHVLYHLEDQDSGIRELARVLRPGGRLIATTNADSINPLIVDLHDRAIDSLGIPREPDEGTPFSLENGAAPLARWFGRVSTHVFEDTGTSPSVAAFLGDYLTLGRYRTIVEDSRIPEDKRNRLADEVRKLAEQTLAAEGVLRTPVRLGAFVCEGPRSRTPAPSPVSVDTGEGVGGG